MDSAEKRLKEIQLALKYCDLDYEEILEDYREHLKYLEKLKGQRTLSNKNENKEKAKPVKRPA